MNAFWRLTVIMVMVGGCDDAPTEPGKPLPLDAQIAYVRRSLAIPDLEGNPLVPSGKNH